MSRPRARCTLGYRRVMKRDEAEQTIVATMSRLGVTETDFGAFCGVFGIGPAVSDEGGARLHVVGSLPLAFD
jgi:hypothetical protein